MYKFETQEVEEPGFDRTDRFPDYLQVVFYFTDYIPIRTSEVVSMCSYRQFVYTYQGHRGNIQRKIKIILGGQWWLVYLDHASPMVGGISTYLQTERKTD